MKAFEEVFSELRSHLEALESQRAQDYNKAKGWLTAAIGIGAAGLIVYVVVPHPATIIAGIIIALVIFYFGYYSASQKFKNEFKDKIFAQLVKAVNPSLTYNKSGFIPRNVFYESRIFTETAHRYSGEDLVKGKIDKTEIEFSEIHAQERRVRTDGKRTRTEYVTFFRGFFMIADFHKNFQGHTVVLPDTAEKLFGFIGKKLQKWNFSRDQLIHLEDTAFEKEFVVYGSDQIEARYILSTSLIQRILELKKKHNTRIYLSFLNSKVFIAIWKWQNLFEPSFKANLLNPETFRKFYNELESCISIVEDLNLNTRIWTKQ